MPYKRHLFLNSFPYLCVLASQTTLYISAVKQNNLYATVLSGTGKQFVIAPAPNTQPHKGWHLSKSMQQCAFYLLICVKKTKPKNDKAKVSPMILSYFQCRVKTNPYQKSGK